MTFCWKFIKVIFFYKKILFFLFYLHKKKLLLKIKKKIFKSFKIFKNIFDIITCIYFDQEQMAILADILRKSLWFYKKY